MRRALVLFAVIGVAFASFAYPQNSDVSSETPLGSGRISVVAQGLLARALAVSPDNSLLVVTADTRNRVFVLNAGASPRALPGGASLIPVAGDGESGFLGDGGAATAAQLSLDASHLYERSGIAVANDGSLFIADTANSTVREVAGPASSEPGVIRSIAGKWGPRQNLTLTSPLGLAVDRSGNVFIADRAAGALDVFDPTTETLSAVAQVAGASSVALNRQGSIAYISSTQTGSVFAVDLPSHTIQQLKALDAFSNALAFDVPPCSTQSQAVCPAGLAVDGAGNLFVSDATFGRILRVDRHSLAASAAISNLQQPGAIAFDSSGRNLYIVEQGLNRIIVADNSGDPPPVLSIAPTAGTFANEPIGGVSPQQQFTVMNSSSSAVSGLTVSSPLIPSMHGNFSLESTSCSSTLAANATCVVNVSFTPTMIASNLTGAVAVSDTANDSASAILSGTGDDFQIQLAPNQSQELSVLPGKSVTFNLQAITVAPSVFGQNGEQVAITCPNNVPLHSTCAVAPPTVSPKPGSPASFTVTIQTSSALPTVGMLPAQPLSQNFPIAILAAILLAIILAGLLLSVPRPRLIAACAFVGALFLFNGCHHASQTNLATPFGSAQLFIQGSALAQDGSSLNASRGTTITVDVVPK